jgi:hypothetical protein
VWKSEEEGLRGRIKWDFSGDDMCNPVECFTSFDVRLLGFANGRAEEKQ